MIHRILNILYSLWFNFRYLPLGQAIKMPVLIRTNMRIEKLRRGQIIIKHPQRFGIMLGGGKSPSMNAFRGCLSVNKGGVIVFHGKTEISQGVVLRCDKDGVMEFGEHFYCNCNGYFRSGSLIRFGDNCSLGWNITVNTSDGHHIWHNGDKVEMEAPVVVGNNVWLTPEVTLLKGVVIPSHCIVAQRAVVTHQFKDEHCLIGGIPAKIVTRNISWKA